MTKIILALLSIVLLALIFIAQKDQPSEEKITKTSLSDAQQKPESPDISTSPEERNAKAEAPLKIASANNITDEETINSDFASSPETDDTDYEQDIHQPELPGEEIKYKLELGTLDFYDLDGRVNTEIGGLDFKAKLTPTSEVILDIDIDNAEEMILKANIDIANFTMELDGSGAILSQDQKTLMAYTADHLRQKLIEEYQDEIPYHGLMTVQMLTYWSKSPPGYRHEKRNVVSN